MKIDKAINRFTWRLTEGGFKGNQTDEDAINTIIEFVNESRKETLNENQLLAKLFIEVWKRTLKIQKKRVFDKEATRWILEAFEFSIQQHIEMFTKELNEQEIDFKLNDLGINNSQHPLVFKTNHPKEQKKEVDLLVKNHQDVFKKEWTNQEVEYFIVSSINHLVNKFE